MSLNIKNEQTHDLARELAPPSHRPLQLLDLTDPGEVRKEDPDPAMVGEVHPVHSSLLYARLVTPGSRRSSNMSPSGSPCHPGTPSGRTLAPGRETPAAIPVDKDGRRRRTGGGGAGLAIVDQVSAGLTTDILKSLGLVAASEITWLFVTM